MSINQTERRRFPRIKLLNPLSYRIRGIPKSYTNTISDNISLNGIGFTNNEFLAPNTTLMLEINMPAKTINTVGRVARASPLPHSDRYSVGVEFIELDTANKEYLQELINTQ